MVIMSTKAIPLIWPNEHDELQFNSLAFFTYAVRGMMLSACQHFKNN